MGNKSWTTDRQRKFLKDNVPQYENAQKHKKTPQWLAAFNERWFQQFPVASPVNEEVVIQLTKKVSDIATSSPPSAPERLTRTFAACPCVVQQPHRRSQHQPPDPRPLQSS